MCCDSCFSFRIFSRLSEVFNLLFNIFKRLKKRIVTPLSQLSNISVLVRSSNTCSMELVCSIMAFVHDSSVLYVLQYRFVILEYRFLCSFPCTLSINKPSVYFSPSPRKEREDPVVPVSLVEHFSPTLLELCFSNPVSYY